jgi:hypothetical protein
MGKKNRNNNTSQAPAEEVLQEGTEGEEVLDEGVEVADSQDGADNEAPEVGGGDSNEEAPSDTGPSDEIAPESDQELPEPGAEDESGDPAPEAEEAAPEASADESADEDEPEPEVEAPVNVVVTPEASKAVEGKTTLELLREELNGKLPVEALQAWDAKQLQEYKNTGLQPALTKRGNWPTDLRRGRNVRNWDASVFLDFIDGFINVPNSMDEEEIYDEIYRRYNIPANWTIEAAVTYINGGGKPAYTASNVLVNDRMRDSKTLSQWSFLEIRTALLGEIESKFSKEELVAALRTRLGLQETYSAKRLLENLNESPTEASVNNILLKSKLDEFLVVMTKNPKHLTEATAGAAQTMLYRAIRSVMQRDAQSFHEGWIIILDFINENYNKAFTEEKVRKGYSQMGISGGAAATFEDLMTLLIHTRKPATRVRDAKLYNLPNILRHVTSEQERTNVIHFYAE